MLKYQLVNRSPTSQQIRIPLYPFREVSVKDRGATLKKGREAGILRPPYSSPVHPNNQLPDNHIPTLGSQITYILLGRREEEKQPKILTLEVTQWNGPAIWTVSTHGKWSPEASLAIYPEHLVTLMVPHLTAQTRHGRQPLTRNKGSASGVEGQGLNTPNPPANHHHRIWTKHEATKTKWMEQCLWRCSRVKESRQISERSRNLCFWPEGKLQLWRRRYRPATSLIKSRCVSDQRHQEKESGATRTPEGERESSENRETEWQIPNSGYKLYASLQLTSDSHAERRLKAVCRDWSAAYEMHCQKVHLESHLVKCFKQKHQHLHSNTTESWISTTNYSQCVGKNLKLCNI